jgi:hypothetical protein
MAELSKQIDSLKYIRKLKTRARLPDLYRTINHLYLFSADIIDRFSLQKKLRRKKDYKFDVVAMISGLNNEFFEDCLGYGMKAYYYDLLHHKVWCKIIDSVIEGNIVVLNNSGNAYVCVEYLNQDLSRALLNNKTYRQNVDWIKTKGRFPIIVFRIGNIFSKATKKRYYMVSLSGEQSNRLIEKLESGFEFPKYYRRPNSNKQ